MSGSQKCVVLRKDRTIEIENPKEKTFHRQYVIQVRRKRQFRLEEKDFKTTMAVFQEEEKIDEIMKNFTMYLYLKIIKWKF